MSCLFVLCVASPQAHLASRRNGYTEHALDGVWFLVREAQGATALGHRNGPRIRFEAQLLDDFAAITGPGEASFFCVDRRPQEDLRAQLRRGRRLPLTPTRDNAVLIDQERYPVRPA